MVNVSLKELFEAGVHFGHQTKRWNPKMRPYIFGQKNGIHLIDLQVTLDLFLKALQFITQITNEGKTILFVGTKRQAQEVILEESSRCTMYYVNQRWLGGLLTNFVTIQRNIHRLKELESMSEDGRYEKLPKKEVIRLERERMKLEKLLSGVKDMEKLPDAIFIVDVKKERIAFNEAKRLNIPVVGIVDTNCDPDGVDYLIPGNDDAIRSIRLFASKIAEATLEGLEFLKKKEEEAWLIKEAGRKLEEQRKEASKLDKKVETKKAAAKKKSAATKARIKRETRAPKPAAIKVAPAATKKATDNKKYPKNPTPSKKPATAKQETKQAEKQSKDPSKTKKE